MLHDVASVATGGRPLNWGRAIVIRSEKGPPTRKPAAFAIALDEDFPQEELNKLGQWRQQVRGTEDGQN